MNKMRLFIDTHDRTKNTFPETITVEEFESFFAKYEQACREENVIPLRAHVGFQEGRAFCLNMAENIEAIARAHEKVGLPYDSIVEVTTATPGDMFFSRS